MRQDAEQRWCRWKYVKRSLYFTDLSISKSKMKKYFLDLNGWKGSVVDIAQMVDFNFNQSWLAEPSKGKLAAV